MSSKSASRDILLPGATGYKLIEELSAKHRLRGIAMSGFSSNADLAQTGFLEHLVTPIDAKTLDAAIQRVIEIQR